MELHDLDKLFNPTSIAVIGASERANAVGTKLFSNLIQSRFAGQLYPINPKYKTLQGKACYSSIKEISHSIDLAVIITPALTVPEILVQCGEKTVRAVVIISAGFGEAGKEGKQLEQKIIDIAQHYHIRIIGPNCFGILRPHLGINATFGNNQSLSGGLALISQSGALCASILDWAIGYEIGFSAVISLGNAADIDFGELLAYLATDKQTKSILLYIEGIHNGRNFMEGLQIATRKKPVIIIKTGRHKQSSKAAASHTGAMVGADDVFDAAIRRAGAVRVYTIEQLFSAAHILANNYKINGNRLAIVTNGGGPGVMAADRASEIKVSIPELSAPIIQQLNKVLPPGWSHHNPIDIMGDATPQRYHDTIQICLADESFDAILTMLTPVAMSQPTEVAQEIIQAAQKSQKPILACWLGYEQVKKAWELFAHHKLPCFATPENAVEAFSYLASYHDNQQFLSQAENPRLPAQHKLAEARSIIDRALNQNRNILTMTEAKMILNHFGIPTGETIEAHTSEEAIIAAESLGFPVAMKISSPDITHKQDIGGVILNVQNKEDVIRAFNQILTTAKDKCPKAKINGVTVEYMQTNPHNRELMIGVVSDPIFGPVINFGAGGSLVEIMHDRTVALPPLNHFIAKKLIEHTRIFKLLGAFRNMPAVNLEPIEDVLLRVSDMVCELPQIKEMDINPLIVNEKEIVAVDARIIIAPVQLEFSRHEHLAIHP